MKTHIKFVITSVLILIVSLTYCNNAFSQAQSYSNHLLSVEQVNQDLALLENAYSRMHPGYIRYTNEETLKAALEQIKSKAETQGGMQVGDFYLAIQRWLSLIKCDHTKANLPKAMSKERDTAAVYLPFRWVWLENRAFIVLPPVNDKKDKLSNQLEKFDEIIAIDNKPIQEMVEQVIQYIPYDGYTHWARRSGISESLEFKGGAIDHFGAL